MKVPVAFWVCFLGTFYATGFVLLGRGLLTAHRSARAAAWPTAPATITKLEVREVPGDGTTYKVEVWYTYTVDGVAYEGSRFAFGYWGSEDREPQDAIYRRLKGAESVHVRYDPANPAESCLSFGLDRAIWFGMVLGGTFILFTIGMTVVAWLLSRDDTVLLDNLSVQ